MTFSRFSFSVVVVALGVLPRSYGAGRIAVMLLDGESAGAYHAWQTTTPVLKKELEETGLFQVDVVTAPAPGADFSAFRPNFGRYQAVVMNYDAPDERWPDPVKSAFEAYVRGGGGLVIFHAANNAFLHWPEYNDMIGLGWRSWRSSNSRLSRAGKR